jgi:hypothetical protein
MSEFLFSTWVIDGLIVVLLAEALVLRGLQWRRGARAVPRGLSASLMAGLFLMLAIRLALTGSHGLWFAALLLASGLAHAFDLRERFRS